MHDKVSIKEALNEASRDAEAFRNARKNADEVVELRDEIARLRAELDKRPNLDANDCTALLCVISGDIVQPDLGWFGRIEDELSAVAKRG